MTVNIKGIERFLSVNMVCQKAYTEKINMDAPIETAIYATVWGMLQGGAYANGVDLELTFGDVIDWVDEDMNQDSKKVTEICNVWTDSLFYKKWLKAVQDSISEVEKKSQLMSIGLKSTK